MVSRCLWLRKAVPLGRLGPCYSAVVGASLVQHLGDGRLRHPWAVVRRANTKRIAQWLTFCSSTTIQR